MTSYVAAGSEFSVNSTFARSQSQADGAQLADGRSIVTWIDAELNTSANRFIKAQFYNSDGTPAGAELTLVSTTAVNPAVTGLAGGGFVVTWQGSGIRAQVFDQNGVAVAPAEMTMRSPITSRTAPKRSISTLRTRRPLKRTRRTCAFPMIERFARARTSRVRYPRAALTR